MSNRIAYFTNQYPKVSHSFIRREILALEKQGLNIQRIALRGWNDVLVDEEDVSERKNTHYVLQKGIAGLLLALIRTLFTRPIRFASAFILTLKMSYKAERSLPYHLIYLAEACKVLLLVKNFGASHIHAHFGTNPAEVVMLMHALGGPSYSFTVHGPEEFDRPKFIKLGDKISRAAFVVAISSYGRSQLYRWVEHNYWSKINVVHCGLENSFYDVPINPVPSIPRLVCVGRLCEQKGQLLLIEAAHQLALKNINFELVLAGDGEMRIEVEKLIEKYALSDCIRITGWISSEQVRGEMLASRGLVLPSFAEGLPVVIMEAMALRRPVLTTYVAGIPELVRHKENGWLFPAGSVNDLEAAMADFLSQSDDVLKTMGEAAYHRVIKRHNVDHEAAKLVALFKKSHT